MVKLIFVAPNLAFTIACFRDTSFASDFGRQGIPAHAYYGLIVCAVVS